jgi:hypothetical protein
MFGGDEYNNGRKQAENGVMRDIWGGSMSSDERRGYLDELDRQEKLKKEREQLYASVPAEGGDDLALVLIAAFVLFALFIAAQVIADKLGPYLKPTLWIVGTTLVVVFLAWVVSRIPRHKRKVLFRGAEYFILRSINPIRSVGSAVWKQLVRARRKAKAILRRRPLPNVEKIRRD